jgi:hypothetical protein
MLQRPKVESPKAEGNPKVEGREKTIQQFAIEFG